MAFSADPIIPGVPPCSPCQSRRRATEQRKTSQTAGQRRPDGGLETEGRHWGDKLIGLSIDLEELHSASRALEARVDEARAGNQELQSYVQRFDSGLVDEDQEPPDELNYLTEDDLPSEIPSSDIALRELEEFLRQNQQDPGPNSGSDDPSDSA
jgi:hypothetical protein